LNGQKKISFVRFFYQKIIYLFTKTAGLKKSIAIILLLIHGFNLVGYPAMFALLQHNAGHRFIAQIDEGQYNDADLVEVKIPYPLPYSTNWKHYERINGEMEVQGIHYNYVKRKLSNDTLYLMCIPNTEKTKLSADSKDYFNVFNGVNDGSTNKKSTSQESFQKSFCAEYNIIPANYLLHQPTVSLSAYFSVAKTAIALRALSVACQPPED
jgi:hypothetical protein